MGDESGEPSSVEQISAGVGGIAIDGWGLSVLEGVLCCVEYDINCANHNCEEMA